MGWNETKAAYRFFDNDKVSPDAIYAAHREATLERMLGQSILLAVQDTCAFNFTLHRATKGLGPIAKEGLSGFFLHSCFAVSTEGVPQGLLAHRLWARPNQDKETRKPPNRRPLEEKESNRWIEVTEEAAQGLPLGTKVVMVGDRESDIYDLFVLACQKGYDVLIRAIRNRRLVGDKDLLWNKVAKEPILGTTTFIRPRSKDHPEREVTATVQTATVTFQTPVLRRKDKLANPTVNAVLLTETSTPPEGEEPVSWLLLTTLPTTSLADALQCLTWYTYRWRIERFHYTLKSGCLIEKLQLETADRLMRALAVFCVVAWRLLWITYHARSSPDAPCTVVLSQTEWSALYAATNRTAKIPEQPPDLKTAIRWLAKLGGFLGRKKDGDPGVKVLWRGFRRLGDLADMWEVCNPTNTYG